jgi:hypothetical protein
LRHSSSPYFLLDTLGPGFPTHVGSSRLAAAGIFSVMGAIAYVAIMALYYGETIVEQQAELRQEVLSHRRTAQELRDGAGRSRAGEPGEVHNSSPI